MNNLPAILKSPMTWLLGLIVIAAVVVFTASDDDSTDGETAPVEVEGAALVTYSEPDTGAGQTIPTVTASLLDGGTVEVGPDGTGRLIGFFAHWCPHCQNEVPLVRSWLRSTTLPDDFEVLAVSTAVQSRADNYPPSEWFAREDWPTPVLLDDDAGSLAGAYGLTRFPYWVAVDGNGTVVARVTGSLSDAQLDLLVDLVTGGPVG